MNNKEAAKWLREAEILDLTSGNTKDREAVNMAISALQAQIDGDCISRQAAIDTGGLDEEIRCEMCKNPMHTDRGCDGNCKYDEKLYKKIIQILDKRIMPLPSAQPTLWGYNIKHLILIAEILRKENLPPERITEVLTDIGRIVSIVKDEFEETLRKAVEQCKI